VFAGRRAWRSRFPRPAVFCCIRGALYSRKTRTARAAVMGAAAPSDRYNLAPRVRWMAESRGDPAALRHHRSHRPSHALARLYLHAHDKICSPKRRGTHPPSSVMYARLPARTHATAYRRPLRRFGNRSAPRHLEAPTRCALHALRALRSSRPGRRPSSPPASHLPFLTRRKPPLLLTRSLTHPRSRATRWRCISRAGAIYMHARPSLPRTLGSVCEQRT